MKRRTIVWITLLAVVFTLAGCSQEKSGSTSTTLNASSPPPSPQSGSSGSAQQSSGAEGSQGVQIKPEQLISKIEAAALLGEAVRDGATDEFTQLSLCITFYAAENMESKNYLQVAVMQQAPEEGEQKGGSGEQSASSPPSESASPGTSGGSEGSGEKLAPKDIFEGLKKLFSDPFAPTEGRMGDDFFLSAQGISILSGGQYIYISVGSFPAAEAQKLLKQAGELAILNLKRIQGE